MKQLGTIALAVLCGLVVLVTTGPQLTRLLHTIQSFCVTVGALAILARIVWYFTRRY